MKFSANWLREWVDVPGDAQALAHRLTMAGLETSVLGPVAPAFEGVRIVEIVSCEPHPNAERLRVCTIRTARNRTDTVVCGAPNAAPGIRVPHATPGASLPDGRSMQRAGIRGVVSAGMLLSAAELGIEEKSDGLWVLDADAPLGTSLRDWLRLDDLQLEAELTPNRGDCLSILGLARELSALTGKRLRAPPIKTVRATTANRISVRLVAPRDCANYCGRILSGIRSDARTPDWMAERLRRAGNRCIHPVVDVTNYVMLELGQPMHAFDLGRIAGGIQVRGARAREEIELLDGSSKKLDGGTLVIADDHSAVALAGIMGGMASAVSGTTRDIFLESAWFRPEAIGTRARQLGLHTDSSHRFERGVDPTLQRRALERATALLVEIVGGQPGPEVHAHAARYLPKPRMLTLRRAQLDRVLGVKLPGNVVGTVFRRLGMKTQTSANAWRVTPPSYRYDIARECDLIEEVARVHGYERLPRSAPTGTLQMTSVPETRLPVTRLHDLLSDRDYQEAITYSFVDPAMQAALDPGAKPIALRNPIAADLAVMRSTLWPGLLRAALHNLNRQQDRVRLYEIGNRFVTRDGTRIEEPVVAGCVTGTVLPPQWGAASRPADFFDIKSDVEALLGPSADSWQFRPARHPALHPGQSAEIVAASDPGRRMGWVGVMHPDLQARFKLEIPVMLFELRADDLCRLPLPVFREVSRYPSIRRDLAFVVPPNVSARTIMECTRQAAGPLLTDLKLFDLYQGEGIDSGGKSFALALTLQDSSRTLKDDEIETLIGRVVAGVSANTGATLRR